MDAQFKRYRQVAILVSSLERTAADSLLDQLPADESAMVRQAILSLDSITDQEEAEALSEFLRRGGKLAEQLPTKGSLDSGVELDAELAARFGSQNEQKQPQVSVSQEIPAQIKKPEFACLRDINGASLAPLISQEHPQTIAVVVSHLTQSEAARLLGALSAEQQSEIIRRLADLDEMDIDSLRLMERHLEERLSEHVRHKQRRSTGVSNVAAILRAADPITRQRLVQQLRLSDQQLAEQLNADDEPSTTARAANHTGLAAVSEESNSPLPSSAETAREPKHTRTFEEPASFEQLAHWTERSLKTLLKECQPELILLALTGADEMIVRRVLQMFPARQAATLRHALNHPGPIRLSDVEAAQEEIMHLATKLEREGKLASGTGRLSMAA